jgi:hypothetical protein
LDSLPEGLRYFADVRCNLYMFERHLGKVALEHTGRAKLAGHVPSVVFQKVCEITADPSIPWEDVTLGLGSKGPIVAKLKCIMVVEIHKGIICKDVWLYVKRHESRTVKYTLISDSTNATKENGRIPVLLCKSFNQCLRECKEYL